jgi:protoporphyrinogen oxidase
MFSKAFPIKKEKNLEDFFINRFGKVLYKTFFKDYTEKVWGKSCTELSAEWGAQRIKGLSITKVLLHYLQSIFGSKEKDISQKNKETSLIDWFLYPKYGPGQFWETVAQMITDKGGMILFNSDFQKLKINEDKSFDISYLNKTNSEIESFCNVDYVFSTTTVKHLIESMPNVPAELRNISNGLLHRSFITVGLLLENLSIKNKTKIATLNNLIPDNWIYMQEHDVHMGRIQIFNNWSPFMVEDESKVWIGLEYFCDFGDKFWTMNDRDFIDMAISELVKVEIVEKQSVLDSTIIRMEDTYPVYFGTYDNFDLVRNYVDSIDNLFLIGRSGMHRYNNSDHSMLTAITAVQNIIEGKTDKSNIWEVNTEKEYHEENKS